MPERRGNHEGAIYQRSSGGRWLGVALLGYNQRGKPVRKTVSARCSIGPGRSLTMKAGCYFSGGDKVEVDAEMNLHNVGLEPCATSSN